MKCLGLDPKKKKKREENLAFELQLKMEDTASYSPSKQIFVGKKNIYKLLQACTQSYPVESLCHDD
jgi:hypothetical protein